MDWETRNYRRQATALIKNRASGYVPSGVDSLENAPYLDWTIKTGNGSLYSTVEDLYKWDRSLYTEKILKKGSLDKMFTKHVDDSIGYGWFIRLIWCIWAGALTS